MVFLILFRQQYELLFNWEDVRDGHTNFVALASVLTLACTFPVG